MTTNSSNNQIIVAIIPWPEHGHLNQLFHIANFISSHNIPLHFISLTNKNQELKNRAQNSLNSSKIHFNDLLTPSITQNSQPQNVNFADEYAFLEFLDKLGDPICKICVEIAKKAKKLVVVFDSLMTDVIKDVYSISNVECYSFHAISGFTMYSTFRQVVDEQDHDEVARQVFDEMPQSENCVEKGVFDHDEVARKVFDEMPQRENCLGPGIFDRDEVARQVFDELPRVEDCFGPDIFEFVKKERECNLNTGEFMNSCRELEGKYLDLLANVRKKPLFALGPFHMLQELSASSSNGNRHECLEFLDKQDANSVMFVSFGTTTTLSQEQVNELALGLEWSNHKFIWVLREADKKMDTEECEGRKDGNFKLPEGFEERVEGRGMVVRNWVPQLEILGHKSTGGFLSHCGWNSCMESISMGVPIATWPIHVDQPYNAVFVTNVLKIGIPVKSWARREELVTAMAVEKAVKSLMGTLQGEEMHVMSESQNWILIDKDKFKFPGGGTQFIHGADQYLDQIEKMLPEIAFGRHVRVALDIGCGVASFGAYLLSRNVLTLSVAPKDVHENQIQFALERGVPAMVAAIATHRLLYPSQAFDLIHCSRCRINWTRDGGILLLEVNRLLRAGGYFVWAAQPVYKHEAALEEQWEEMVNLTTRLCWNLVKKEGYIAIWQKPMNNSCYLNREEGTQPPLCDLHDDPDDVWYVDLKACITRLPEEGYGANITDWPSRLQYPPDRLQSIQVDSFMSRKELFKAESKFWKEIIGSYVRAWHWKKFKLRNVMDMRAGFGGFAAALIENQLDCWVLNVVPVSGQNTLPVIFDRGLLGVMHDWCEPFDTYPRTYDLLHANGLFSIEQKRCNMSTIMLEMDRILRPGGRVYIRDSVAIMDELQDIGKAMGWHVTVRDTSEGPHASYKILTCDKHLLRA